MRAWPLRSPLHPGAQRMSEGQAGPDPRSHAGNVTGTAAGKLVTRAPRGSGARPRAGTPQPHPQTGSAACQLDVLDDERRAVPVGLARAECQILTDRRGPRTADFHRNLRRALSAQDTRLDHHRVFESDFHLAFRSEHHCHCSPSRSGPRHQRTSPRSRCHSLAVVNRRTLSSSRKVSTGRSERHAPAATPATQCRGTRPRTVAEKPPELLPRAAARKPAAAPRGHLASPLEEELRHALFFKCAASGARNAAGAALAPRRAEDTPRHREACARSAATRYAPYLTPLARRNSAYCRSSFMMCSVNHFFRKLNVLIDTG